MIFNKGYLKAICLMLLCIGLTSCNPPVSGELSLALNLQENDTYKMELELREIIEQDIMGKESVELSINRWELSFRVQNVDDKKIDIEVAVDSVSLLKEGIDKLLSQRQMAVLSGQMFEFEIDRHGEVLAISGVDEIESFFIENFDFADLLEGMMGGGMQTFGESEEDSVANEHISDIVESAREGYQPIISMAFDMLLGEELMFDIL